MAQLKILSHPTFRGDMGAITVLISGWSLCDFSDAYLSWIWLGGYFSDITSCEIRFFLLAGNCCFFVQLDVDGFCNWVFGDRKVRAVNHHQWSSMHVRMSKKLSLVFLFNRFFFRNSEAVPGWWFHTFFLISISYMGFHASHWRTHIFQKGRSTTNQ